MKKQNGITLIALVITIIVLLILAGVSISMVIGDNGILKQATGAVAENKKAAAKEEVTFAWASAETEFWNEWTKDTSKQRTEYFTESKLNEFLGGTGTVSELVYNANETSTLKYTSEGLVYEMQVDAMGKVTILEESEEEGGETLPEDEEEELPEVTTEEPNITVTTSVVDMTITATVTLNNSENVSSPVTYSYYIKKATEADSEYEMKDESESLTCDFVTTEATTYDIKVVATTSDSKIGSDTEQATTVTVCFVAGTKVLTETGFKNIEDIVIGEKVYSLNTDNNQKELREVTNTMISTSNEIYKITVGDKLVEATPKHKFYIVDKGWIRAKELEIGDKIVAKDDSSMEIKSIELEKYEEPIKVYNLTVEGTHTYLITELELLVHNVPSMDDPLEEDPF